MEIKIYTLSSTRNPNNIRYVGKTKQTLSRRLQGHLCAAKKSKKLNYHNNYNYNWINKEESEGFEILILELDSLEFNDNEDWKWFEQYWISQLKIWGFKLNNLTEGGDGNQNQVFSKESIEKRASKIRGVPRDDETKRKISVGLTGIKRSEETKLKVKNSITLLQGQKIKQFEKNGTFIKEWPSIAEASRVLNIDKANIGHCCSHAANHNSAGGYIWRYINDTTPIVAYTKCSVCQCDLEGNLIKIFRTAADASKELNIATTSISLCCNNHIDSVKGFVFKLYKNL